MHTTKLEYVVHVELYRWAAKSMEMAHSDLSAPSSVNFGCQLTNPLSNTAIGWRVTCCYDDDAKTMDSSPRLVQPDRSQKMLRPKNPENNHLQLAVGNYVRGITDRAIIWHDHTLVAVLGKGEMSASHKLTRMSAINVSIPNLTVARLEQFRSPQLRIQTELPTDVGVDWKQTVLSTKASCHYLASESICS